jgi:hypothetical protein
MKFKGNTKMMVERLNFYDEFGQAVMSIVLHSFCSVVKISQSIEKTPIRSSQAASTANSEETESISVLMMSIDDDIRLGDRITVAGMVLRIDKRQIWNTTKGTPHHLWVELSQWV